MLGRQLRCADLRGPPHPQAERARNWPSRDNIERKVRQRAHDRCLPDRKVMPKVCRSEQQRSAQPAVNWTWTCRCAVMLSLQVTVVNQ